MVRGRQLHDVNDAGLHGQLQVDLLESRRHTKREMENLLYSK